MLVQTNAKDGTTSFFYTSEPFTGHFKRSGYYKVEVMMCDTSNLSKGYLTFYVYDMEMEEVIQTNLLIKHLGESTNQLPLEQLIELLIQQKYKDSINCLQVELDMFVGLQCQFLVESEKDYFNVVNVYPINEELPTYEPKNTLPESLRKNYPNGVF